MILARGPVTGMTAAIVTKNTGKAMEDRVMSMDIYFDANRAEKVTPEEDARIEEISRKYMEEYKGEDYEGPGRFAYKEGGPIFSGNIRIPFDLSEDALDEFFHYWLKWLTEITKVLVDAEWNVTFADVPALWDEEIGWRMMTDEEYGELYGELL